MNEAYRLYLMKNDNNRFICDKKKNVIHDRHCINIGKIKEKDAVPLSEISNSYMKDKKLCPVCRRRLAIRNGMRGAMRNSENLLRNFMSFLGQAGASNDDLIRLFIKNGGTISCISSDTIGIDVRDDRWRVTLRGPTLELYHNSYWIDEDYTRVFTGQFHRQNDFDIPSFHNFTGIISRYDYDFYHQK